MAAPVRRGRAGGTGGAGSSRPEATTSQTDGGHAAGRGGALRHEADPLPVAEVGERRAEEADDAAARQRQQPGDRADQGRLARAVGAHQRHELAGPDGEVDRRAGSGGRRSRPRPSRTSTGRCSGAHWHPFASWSASRFWPHEGKVVLVGRLVASGPRSGRAPRSRRRGRRPASRPSCGLTRRSEKTVVMPSSVISSWSRARSAGVGSASGERPAIARSAGRSGAR